MTAVKIIVGILLVILLLLLIPLTYSISFEKWKLTVRVGALFGLISKVIEIDPMKKKKKESEESAEELDEALDELDESVSGKTGPIMPEEPLEIKTDEKSPTSAESRPAEKKPEEEEKEEPQKEESKKNKKNKPSLLAQGRFALDNGLIKLVLIAAAKIIDHGFPRRWQVEGKLGLPDPMYTGVFQGLLYAPLPGAAEEIEWDYLETVFTLKGRGRGRLIPLYVLYILLKLAVSKEAREFWHFRQGGKQNG